MGRMLLGIRLLALAVLCLALVSARAATITVTTAKDDKTPNDGTVSLREAITAINAGNDLGDPDIIAQSPGTFGVSDTINFNIPASGVQTIHIGADASAAGLSLPFIVKPVVINGYSQPGASPNTLAVGDDAVILIELDAAATLGLVLNLQPGSAGSTIRGLSIVNFGDNDVIRIQSDNNLIAGNFIGVDPTGLAVSPVLAGGIPIDATSVNGTVIGGSTPAARNIITSGVLLDTGTDYVHLTDATNSTIQGNYFGTNKDGTAALGGILAVGGIVINAGNNNLIGGTVPGAGNVIVVGIGGGDGVFLSGDTQTVQGNFIGTNAAGTAVLGSGVNGIDIGLNSNAILIGGPGGGNVISGATRNGILITVASTAWVIQGNKIGTDVTGAAPIPNGFSGICIDDGGTGGTIGGAAAGQGNVIAFNGSQGVEIGSGVGRTITGNSITGNGALGISLKGTAPCGLPQTPTANDPGDADSGPNNLQNYPVIATAVIASGNVTVSGTLNSTALQDFNIAFYSNAACDPSGNGEGQTFLGSTGVSTDASGNASFSGLTFPVPAGQTFITATTTDTNNPASTSEFSACLNAGGAPSADLSITKTAAASVSAGTNLSYTINVLNGGPSAASGVTLTDALPAGTTFVSLTAPAGWATVTPAVGGTGTVTATNPSLANGATGSFTLVVNVNAAVAAGTVVTNTATLTATTTDPNPGNNSATAATTVAAVQADLSVTKVAPATATAGGNLTYQITVTNAGPNDAAAVSVTDTLPASTTFVSVIAPGGWTVTTPAVGTTGTFTATNPSMVSSSSAVFTIVVQVTAGTTIGTVITNTVNVSSSTSDPTPGNNTATALTTVSPVVVTTSTPVPTLSEGSLVALALLLALTAVARARRRP